MRQINLIFLIGLTILATNGFGQQIIGQCTIKGEVLNRDSKVLTIRKTSESFRSFINSYPKIKINEGKFDYTFSYSETEAYQLIFEDELNRGNWVPIVFFPIHGVVDFKLYPQADWNKNVIRGDALNSEYETIILNTEKLFAKRKNELYKTQRALYERNEFNSLEYEELIKQLRAAKTQEEKIPLYQKSDELEKTHARYTDRAKQHFLIPYDSLMNAELQWKYDYIKRNVSLVSYYMIWSDVEMQMKSKPLVAKLATDVFPLFEKKYPEHIYTQLIGTQLKGLQTVKTGNKYIDIKAPSVANGDTFQLSKIIQNHVALIDLWGSWCGPCIAKSRLVIPIYNKYKDKGFKIIGIAREFKTTSALKKRISIEQFPWANLFDLDDKLNIWNQYGISNGVGLMVLVDKDGTILSIDPKPEELDKILEQKLN